MHWSANDQLPKNEGSAHIVRGTTHPSTQQSSHDVIKGSSKAIAAVGMVVFSCDPLASRGRSDTVVANANSDAARKFTCECSHQI